jgi:flagellar biosynthesis protein FlhG
MTHIWPIGGGKGGSGKSFLVGNLGIWLAKQGNKTLLLDADFGGANLHTMIGVPHQQKGLADFLSKKVQTLGETAIETKIPNLSLISGADNHLDMANMAYEQKMKIFRAISKLSYDYILLDLGAGTSFNTIDFFLISDGGIFVTTPEPTSIENVYRLIRAVYVRKIRQFLKTYPFRTLLEKAEEKGKGGDAHKPEYLIALIKDLDPEKGKIMEEALRASQFKLVLNQFRKQDHPKMGVLICRIVEKHLGLPMQFVGNIAHDDLVRDAVCQKVPFVERYPHTQTAIDLKKICQNILESGRNGEIPPPAAQSLEEGEGRGGKNEE